MTEYTGSISRGRTAEKHNTRECYSPRNTPSNINGALSKSNVFLVNRTLDDVYTQRFELALEAYNKTQCEKGHPGRQIENYLEHVRNDKKLQPMYEFVIQVGNKDVHPDNETAEAVYRDFLKRFNARYGVNFEIKQAVIHFDEATPHMHLELVPVAASKRGLSTQNSMNKAVKQSGHSNYKEMLTGWDSLLDQSMDSSGLTRIAGDKDKQAGGVDIETYKRTMAARQALENEKAELESVREDIKRERARLELVRQERERAEQRVGVLESISSACNAVDNAPDGPKVGLLCQLFRFCIEQVRSIAVQFTDEFKKALEIFPTGRPVKPVRFGVVTEVAVQQNIEDPSPRQRHIEKDVPQK